MAFVMFFVMFLISFNFFWINWLQCLSLYSMLSLSLVTWFVALICSFSSEKGFPVYSWEGGMSQQDSSRALSSVVFLQWLKKKKEPPVFETGILCFFPNFIWIQSHLCSIVSVVIKLNFNLSNFYSTGLCTIGSLTC